MGVVFLGGVMTIALLAVLESKMAGRTSVIACSVMMTRLSSDRVSAPRRGGLACPATLVCSGAGVCGRTVDPGGFGPLSPLR